jgi:hypothetical protein
LTGTEVFTPGDRTDAAGFYQVIVPADSYTFRFLLGPSHAVPDSVILTGVQISADTVLDVTIGGSPSPAGDLPPVARSAVAAHPKPINPATSLAFEVPRTGRVRLSVHGLDGRLVARLVDEELPAGSHAVSWNGRDHRGRPLASGVYLVALQTGEGLSTTKVALVK